MKPHNPLQCLILVFQSAVMPPNVPPSRERYPVFLIRQMHRLGNLHRPIAPGRPFAPETTKPSTRPGRFRIGRFDF